MKSRLADTANTFAGIFETTILNGFQELVNVDSVARRYQGHIELLDNKVVFDGSTLFESTLVGGLATKRFTCVDLPVRDENQILIDLARAEEMRNSKQQDVLLVQNMWRSSYDEPGLEYVDVDDAAPVWLYRRQDHPSDMTANDTGVLLALTDYQRMLDACCDADVFDSFVDKLESGSHLPVSHKWTCNDCEEFGIMLPRVRCVADAMRHYSLVHFDGEFRRRRRHHNNHQMLSAAGDTSSSTNTTTRDSVIDIDKDIIDSAYLDGIATLCRANANESINNDTVKVCVMHSFY